jgi:hypothetical protein
MASLIVEVGQALVQAQNFHLFSKAQAQARLKSNLFSGTFQAQKISSPKFEAGARPKHKKIRPDLSLLNWTLGRRYLAR